MQPRFSRKRRMLAVKKCDGRQVLTPSNVELGKCINHPRRNFNDTTTCEHHARHDVKLVTGAVLKKKKKKKKNTS
jgi:hypothetical protein